MGSFGSQGGFDVCINFSVISIDYVGYQMPCHCNQYWQPTWLWPSNFQSKLGSSIDVSHLRAEVATYVTAFPRHRLHGFRRSTATCVTQKVWYQLLHSISFCSKSTLRTSRSGAVARPFTAASPDQSVQEKRSVAYPPHGPPLGEDVQLDAVARV